MVTHLYPVNFYLSQAKESKGENQIECEKLKRNENKNSEFFLNLRTTLGRCVELDYGTAVGISFLRNIKPNLVPQCNSTHPVPKTAMFETLARTGENVAGILFCTEEKGKKHTCQLPVTGSKPTEMHGSWVFHSIGGLTGPHPSPLL